MSITKQSSDALSRQLQSILPQIVNKIRPALVKSVEEVAADARTLAEATRRTGSLADSIAATHPGQTTPAYATEGGQRTASETQAFVTAGSPQARHGHFAEFGTEERQRKDGTSTGTMPASPFLLPAWRLNKARVDRRINRAINAGIKEATQK